MFVVEKEDGQDTLQAFQVVEVAESLSCVQLFCHPVDCSQPSSSVHGILQARILEWIAIPSSGGSSKGLNLPSLMSDLHGRQVLYHWHHPESTKDHLKPQNSFLGKEGNIY